MNLHCLILRTANSALSGGRGSALTFGTLFSGTFTLLVTVITAAGVGGRMAYFAVALIAVVTPFAIAAVLYLCRWNLLIWALRSETEWFLLHRPKLLIAVGPGGAIVAGLISKFLNQACKDEPVVVVANRKYAHDGPATDREVHFELPKSLIAERASIVVVTSEVHSGRTLLELRKIFKKKYGSEFLSFSILWNPKSEYSVTRYLVASDSRGILPWPDEPGRNVEVSQLATA